ncbi:hypothetical protein LMIY3S_03141 [Labrys miyagiensis]
MPRITYYVVLPFIRTEDGELLGIEAEEAPTHGQAEFRGRDMVGHTIGANQIVGTIVFSRTGDPQLGDFGDAAILARYGETPDDVEGIE